MLIFNYKVMEKMKHIIILLFISLFIFLGSCKKVLDVAPDGRISYDDIFSDNDKVSAYLNTCYLNMPTKGERYYFFSRGPVEWCDDAWDADAESESSLMSGRMYNGNASASFFPIIDVSTDANNGDYWDYYWHSIWDCCTFLNRIDKATVKSENNRDRWKAEAHLLRAFYYSELLRWFGMSLPIERKPYSYDMDFSTVKRSSYYDVTKFIMEDCDSALASTNLPWRITTTGEAGRVTKAMAEAIKSRMILYAASPLYNAGKNYWEEAYQTNKTVLNDLAANGYSLYNTINYASVFKAATAYFPNDYAALYNEYFNNSMAYSSNPVDKETIYQTTGGQGQNWNTDGIGAQNSYKTGTCPSQELVDAYETTDGKPVLNLASPYLDEQHTLPNYNAANTLYDPQHPYSNRDPRFYGSIYYNGSKRKAYWGFAEVKASVENYPAAKGNRTRIIATWNGEPATGIDRNVRYLTRTGYFERKFLHPFAGSDNNVSGANFKLFRLGEVYLNLAEAAAEAGHLDEARNAVNTIRERVGMPDLPSGLSSQDLIIRIHNERRVELAMEEDRYFDVRRWQSPSGDLSATDKWITAMDITRKTDGTFIYTRRPVRAIARACYTNRYLKIPISLNESNRTKTLSGESWQNPGW